MLKTHQEILSESELRNVIPSYAKILDKRIQPQLDFFSREFMEQACIAILGSSNKDISMTSIHYQQEANIVNDNLIELNNLHNIQKICASTKPCFVSLFIIVPGVGHCLRVNGTLENFNNQKGLLTIKEVYFHCARAASRSEFWGESKRISNLELTADNILKHSPYALLKTMNHADQTELSPRGDEPGFIQTIDSNTLFMPERPGNKVAISLRNIINNPNIELLIIVPGYSHTQNIYGCAYVTTDKDLLKRCTVNGKQPKAGIVINVIKRTFQRDDALMKSELWNAKKMIDNTTLTAFPKALSSHINGTGLMGRATQTIVGAIVKHDMKNLY